MIKLSPSFLIPHFRMMNSQPKRTHPKWKNLLNCHLNGMFVFGYVEFPQLPRSESGLCIYNKEIEGNYVRLPHMLDVHDPIV